MVEPDDKILASNNTMLWPRTRCETGCRAWLNRFRLTVYSPSLIVEGETQLWKWEQNERTRRTWLPVFCWYLNQWLHPKQKMAWLMEKEGGKNSKERKWRLCCRHDRSLKDKEEWWDSDIWMQICPPRVCSVSKLSSETNACVLFKL